MIASQIRSRILHTRPINQVAILSDMTKHDIGKVKDVKKVQSRSSNVIFLKFSIVFYPTSFPYFPKFSKAFFVFVWNVCTFYKLTFFSFLKCQIVTSNQSSRPNYKNVNCNWKFIMLNCVWKMVEITVAINVFVLFQIYRIVSVKKNLLTLFSIYPSLCIYHKVCV